MRIDGGGAEPAGGGADGIEGRPDGSGRRFAVVASRFNQSITERLAAGARECLLDHGANADAIDVVWVPGAWELAPTVGRVAATGRYDAIVAIGCVIRGETPHFEYVAGAAANGLAQVGLDAGVPVTFGVLTTDTPAQAEARAGGEHGNKGWEAALSALEMTDLYGRIEADGART